MIVLVLTNSVGESELLAIRFLNTHQKVSSYTTKPEIKLDIGSDRFIFTDIENLEYSILGRKIDFLFNLTPHNVKLFEGYVARQYGG